MYVSRKKVTGMLALATIPGALGTGGQLLQWLETSDVYFASGNTSWAGLGRGGYLVPALSISWKAQG